MFDATQVGRERANPEDGMVFTMGLFRGLYSLVSGLLRGVVALVMLLLATLLLMVAAVLCVTILLLPLGIPIGYFALRLFAESAKVLVPRSGLERKFRHVGDSLRSRGPRLRKKLPG